MCIGSECELCVMNTVIQTSGRTDVGIGHMPVLQPLNMSLNMCFIYSLLVIFSPVLLLAGHTCSLHCVL